MTAYIVQSGTGTGEFQMAVLLPTSNVEATVIAITDIVDTVTSGIFTLPLISPVTLVDDTIGGEVPGGNGGDDKGERPEDETNGKDEEKEKEKDNGSKRRSEQSVTFKE